MTFTIVWLNAMKGNSAALSAQELTRIICQGPMASGLFDEKALSPYLDGRPPQACRRQIDNLSYNYLSA